MGIWNYDGWAAGPLAMIIAWIILGVGSWLVFGAWYLVKSRADRAAVDRIYQVEHEAGRDR